MANIEKAIEVLNWIEQNQNRWSQNHFVIPADGPDGKEDICNSTFCFAGTALYLGKRVALNEDGAIFPTNEDGTISRSTNWEDMAANLLGITSDQAYFIFYAMTDDFNRFKNHVMFVLDNPNDIVGMSNSKDDLEHGYEDEDEDEDDYDYD